jgi:hypothetical protein
MDAGRVGRELGVVISASPEQQAAVRAENYGGTRTNAETPANLASCFCSRLAHANRGEHEYSVAEIAMDQ